MAAREILLLGNPLLRERSVRVKDFSESSIAPVVADLRDTLESFRRSRGFGRGIAAPQIGVARRIIYIDVGEPLPMINPEIVSRSRRTMTLWDDCFSFPDILAKVRRHLNIKVRFQDPQGKRRTLDAGGDLSELLQHEIDHLDGILAIDRAVDSRHIILRSEWEKLKDRSTTLHPL